LRAAAGGGLGDGITHLAARSIADVADGIEGFLGGAAVMMAYSPSNRVCRE